MRDGADFGGDRRFEAALAENAVSQFSPRQGLGHRLVEHVMMPYFVHQSAVDEDEFQTLPPQPDDLLANHPMMVRRQCSALKALVPKIGAMHIGQR